MELRLIDRHPLDRVRWEAPKRADDADRGVSSPRHAAALLAAA
jgi:hypothetical protein